MTLRWAIDTNCTACGTAFDVTAPNVKSGTHDMGRDGEIAYCYADCPQCRNRVALPLDEIPPIIVNRLRGTTVMLDNLPQE
jgi:hypothetical protein